MKNFKLFAMLMVLAAGYAPQLTADWHKQHETRKVSSHEDKIERYMKDGSMTHGELSRFIDHVQSFVGELQVDLKRKDVSFVQDKCAIARSAFKNIEKRFDSDRAKYSNLKAKINALNKSLHQLEEKSSRAKREVIIQGRGN